MAMMLLSFKIWPGLCRSGLASHRREAESRRYTLFSVGNVGTEIYTDAVAAADALAFRDADSRGVPVFWMLWPSGVPIRWGC